MANMGIMVGWNRAVTGREGHTLAKFGEYVVYLSRLQAEKYIESFEPVLTRPHGGDLNGFFLIRGNRDKFNELRETDHWKDWEVWGAYNMVGFGIVECLLGADMTDSLQRFGKLLKA